MFDFFYGSYKNCPREKLLSFLENRPDFEKIKTLDTQELLITCCEGWAYSAVDSFNKGEKIKEGMNEQYDVHD